MIEARGLTKRYGGTVAVEDLSFAVRPGSVTGFLGPNGSGKSTTMRMIMGLDRPDAGYVTIGGRPYSGLSWPLREVGALLEARTFHPGRSARSHLARHTASAIGMLVGFLFVLPLLLAGFTGTTIAKFFPTIIAGNSLSVSVPVDDVLSPWVGFAVLCLYMAALLAWAEGCWCGAIRELRAVRTVLRAPLTRRTWAQAAYCLLSFVPALVGFVLIVVVALALGSAFTLTVLGAVPGILFLMAGLALARGLGALQRRLARGLIGERVEEPPRPDARRGLVAGVVARLRDATAWRAVAYVLVKLPLATLGLYAVLWWVIGAINVIAPLRWAAGQHDLDLVSPLPGGGPRLHSLGATFAATALGCAILLIAPWLTRAVVAVDRRLLHALLGPGVLAERVRDLEETRALAVEDAAEQLRRLERDLHDGAQVRLAALDVLTLMAEGRSNAAIAQQLHVSAGTVEKHVAAIFGKLDLPVSEDHNRRVLAVIRMLHQDPRD